MEPSAKRAKMEMPVEVPGLPVVQAVEKVVPQYIVVENVVAATLASKADATAQCGEEDFAGVEAVMCERLEDFLITDEEMMSSALPSVPFTDPFELAESTRSALVAQAARMESMFAGRLHELGEAWEGRIAKMQRDMADEREDSQRKLTQLHEALRIQLQRKGRGG